MADEGCKYVFMEVSSHSIAQKRISGLKFAGGIFTNLTRDHLDYHKTVENYLKAKKKFFDDLPKSAFSLTNLDDKNGLVMTQNTRSKVYTYSLRSLCDFKGRVLESHFEGMLLDFNNHELAVQFIVKMMFYSFYLLVILVSFSGNEDYISFFCQHASRANRFFTVGNADRFLHILRIQSGKHIVNDVLRLFEARIV